MLRFSEANAKTKALYLTRGVAAFLTKGRKVYSLDLSAGHSCPGALDCKSMVVPRTDDPTRFKIKDGKGCEFRCFSATSELISPATRRNRRHNFEVLRRARGWRQCYNKLTASLPTDVGVLRYHVSGDFFKMGYLDAAVKLAKARPDVLFYAYTKSLHLLGGFDFPDNFIVTVSRGGKYDYLIDSLGIREAVVVMDEEQAYSEGLPIDHDDSHAATHGGSFALLIHGTQPKGSAAAKALSTLRGGEG